MDDFKFTDNEQASRFEYIVDDAIAFITYKRNADIFTLIHTEVPEALNGTGVGKKLVTLTLEHLKENKYQLIPLCPFVTAFLKRNPEWKTLLAKGYIVK